MTAFDALFTLIILGCIAYFIYNKKKKNPKKESTLISNYALLRDGQATERRCIHGISVTTFYPRENTYSDTVEFDTDIETSLCRTVDALKKDGFSPSVNAIALSDRIVFYITY